MDYLSALAVLEAAFRSSERRGLSMCIAVVDTGGNLITFARMDEAWLGSVDIAIKKARTAVMFDMPTNGLPTQPGEPLYGIEHSNGGLITFPGGVPLHVDGNLVGAIGVSGSTVENDLEVATYAAATLDR